MEKPTLIIWKVDMGSNCPWLITAVEVNEHEVQENKARKGSFRPIRILEDFDKVE
jgi:hypothetical protein